MNAKTLLAYYRLTKPGVMYGNVLTAVAGFLLSSAGDVDIRLLFGMTLGMVFLVSGACALNNYLDRDIDTKMERTKNRPSVTGVISAKNILIYAILLSLLGVLFLYIFTNFLALSIGIIGYVTYVWLYGAWTKRTSVHGTAMGSISGAMPIAAGYAAVSGSLDAGLIIVFAILYLWQFPEFFSIAIYRRKEYKAAGIPVMPVAKGVDVTIARIFIYTALYVVATILLTIFGYTGWTYFIIMLGAGLYWVKIAYQGFGAEDKNVWAKEMFRFSMVMILLLCLMLSIGPVLP
jgi:heme o synthase